jgi:hypothetical protein
MSGKVQQYNGPVNKDVSLGDKPSWLKEVGGRYFDEHGNEWIRLDSSRLEEKKLAGEES